MALNRKIACATALVAAVLVGTPPALGSEAAPGPGEEASLKRARLSQAGRKLVFVLHTARAVPLARLDPLPITARAGSTYLCLALRRAGLAERRLCLGGPRSHRVVGLETVDGAGQIVTKETLAAHVRRIAGPGLVMSIDPGEAGLSPRRYRWRVLARLHRCATNEGCEEALPASGFRLFRLRPVRPVGCSGGSAGLVYNGSRDRPVLALTFDDGPSAYTDGFLAVLRSQHVHATFFEIGQEVAGREETMRRILRDGNEIGNHSTHHSSYPSYEDLATTNTLIRAATHFEPCLFRPPGGAVDPSLVAAAGAAGLRTVLWDVDPTDWMNPGADAVYSRVVDAAQPGSIILMHDGGGDRSGTLAALPRIIETLRARGYGFATVSQLLGERMIYRPYG